MAYGEVWVAGQTASSDGQFFPTTRQGKAMNLINAKYSHEPGLKAYTHVSDQYGPVTTQVIPATVNEAPYILDGLLMNPTGKRIREQYTDTGGFTDFVFAATSILGYLFIPRIRDLPSKRLHIFDRRSVPNELKGLVGDKFRDHTTKGQHFRIAGLNLLTAIIIYWNTKQLGLAVAAQKKAGLDTPEYLLAHISLLGWAHIILTDAYRWRKINVDGA
ncbi:MAG: Tn3 family transposase [Pseudoruegeria sp.]